MTPRCSSGKVGHPTRGHAERVIRAVKRRGGRGGREGHARLSLLQAYPCGLCSAWHVGHGRPKRP